MNLKGIHTLVVDDCDDTRLALRQALEHEGAIVHEASTRTKALGLYFELMADDIVPRAVITDWVLHAPESAEYRFYELIGRPVDNTALHLIQRIRTVDPDVAIVVHSGFMDDIPRNLGVSVVQKGESIARVLQIIDQHPTVLAQRQSFRTRSGEYLMG